MITQTMRSLLMAPHHFKSGLGFDASVVYHLCAILYGLYIIYILTVDEISLQFLYLVLILTHQQSDFSDIFSMTLTTNENRQSTSL